MKKGKKKSQNPTPRAMTQEEIEAYLDGLRKEKGHHYIEDLACPACCTDSSVGCLLSDDLV